jgi:hypothetical protein
VKYFRWKIDTTGGKSFPGLPGYRFDTPSAMTVGSPVTPELYGHAVPPLVS